MKKTILVIGANSALARDVMPVLVAGNTIITGGRKDCDIYCDVLKSVDIPDGVDVVLNFAASFGGTDDAAMAEAVDTNIRGTLNICMAAEQAGVKHVVLISSIFALLDESSAQYSIYALTKRQADELAMLYCRTNKLPLTILRPAQLYGDSDRFARHQPFFYHLLDQAEKGEDNTLYGTNDAKRNYLHTGDLAEIIKLVVAKRIVGIFNCMYPNDVTYSYIAREAQRIFNKGGSVSFAKDKSDIPDNVFPYDPALYEAIDYQPQISITDGIERIKAYRQKEKP